MYPRDNIFVAATPSPVLGEYSLQCSGNHVVPEIRSGPPAYKTCTLALLLISLTLYFLLPMLNLYSDLKPYGSPGSLELSL